MDVEEHEEDMVTAVTVNSEGRPFPESVCKQRIHLYKSVPASRNFSWYLYASQNEPKSSPQREDSADSDSGNSTCSSIQDGGPFAENKPDDELVFIPATGMMISCEITIRTYCFLY